MSDECSVQRHRTTLNLETYIHEDRRGLVDSLGGLSQGSDQSDGK